MNNNKIDIKTDMLFPRHFQFIAVIILIIGLALIVNKIVISIILMLVGIFILSGYSGVQIDKADKVYREYLSFFLIKRGKDIKFSGIEKLYVSSSKVQQKIYTSHTSQSKTFTNQEFNGFIKFDDGSKIHLLTKKKKEKLMSEMQKISAFLNVHVKDNT